MWYNTITKEFSNIEENGTSWVQIPNKPSVACYLAEDLTWQPPLPAQEDKFDFNEEFNSWIKR